ncbi:uncharacterized protein LOC121916232 [Sceloporus undulatus]|uniref:uncharacterized protein LOC121916232 n=1 Tax=Sceloporus undulatus TaxID=8520 RepID=UPI001C4C5033|nr:uncharacterized protein LOC121916232 [Sceloporus undulatus]
MPHSQMLLQLFLGWALLLGRPVHGTEDGFEEQGSFLEEDLETLEEEGEDEVEEEEEGEIVSEELEERLREDEAVIERDPELKEELMDRYSALAMDYYNKYSYGPLYKGLDEDRSLTFKKAIGTMAYLRLFLGKTNCTNAETSRHTPWGISYYLGRERNEPLPRLRRCVLPPLSEREALDCTFDIFLDERSIREKVMGHRCQPLEIDNPGEFYTSMGW